MAHILHTYIRQWKSQWHSQRDNKESEQIANLQQPSNFLVRQR